MNQEHIDSYSENIRQRWEALNYYVHEVKPAWIPGDLFGEPPLSEIDRQLEALDRIVHLAEAGVQLHESVTEILEHNPELAPDIQRLLSDDEFMRSIQECFEADAVTSISWILLQATYFDPSGEGLDEILSDVFRLSPKSLGKLGSEFRGDAPRSHELRIAQHVEFQKILARFDDYVGKRRGWFRKAIRNETLRAINKAEIGYAGLGLTPKVTGRQLSDEKRKRIQQADRYAERIDISDKSLETEVSLVSKFFEDDEIHTSIAFDQKIERFRSYGRGLPTDQEMLFSLWLEEPIPLRQVCRRLGQDPTVANALEKRLERFRNAENRAAASG